MIYHRKLISCQTALASCLVGVIITTYMYIGIGALSNFSTTFSLMMLPPLLASSGFLFWQYLIKQNKQEENIMMPVTEAVSWLIVSAFIIFISKFTLFSLIERAGLFSAFFF